MQTTLLELFGYSFKEEVIGKTTRIKAIYGTGKYRLTILSTKQMKSSRTLKLTTKKKRFALDINIFAETGD
jgi:glycerol kinase